MWLENGSGDENNNKIERKDLPLVDNNIQWEKLDEIKKAWENQQQIDLENARLLSKLIKWEQNQWESQSNESEEILINDLKTFLEWKTQDEKHVILDTIYAWFTAWITKVQELKRKQVDDGFNTDYYLESKISLDWKEIIIWTTFYLYEDFKDTTLKNPKDLVLRILQEQDNKYTPSKLSRFFKRFK